MKQKMSREDLEKEADNWIKANTKVESCPPWGDVKITPSGRQGYLAAAELREKYIKELGTQLTLKIIKCIKFYLCKQDEDYDRPIISPKFLSDILDQMTADGFEEIREK
jgi:hypothetical protein